MATERNYTARDLDAAYNEGHRAGQSPRARIDMAKVFAIIAIIIMVGIMAATFIGYNPFQKGVGAPGAQTQATTPPAPTSDVLALEIARLRAQLAAQSDQSLIVQSVPKGAAPQNLTIAATPVPPTPEPGAPPVDPPPAQQLIVVHEGGSAPRITGSGACKVAMGARRCAK